MAQVEKRHWVAATEAQRQCRTAPPQDESVHWADQPTSRELVNRHRSDFSPTDDAQSLDSHSPRARPGGCAGRRLLTLAGCLSTPATMHSGELDSFTQPWAPATGLQH